MYFFILLLGVCVSVYGSAMYDLDFKSVEFCKNCPNKYAKIHFLQIAKYNHTTKVLRANFSLLVDMPHETEFAFTAYEMKANNDYSKIPIRVFSGKFCQFMQNDPFYYKDLRAHSNYPARCPFKKGDYYIDNYRPNDRYLPPELPGNDWRYDMEITYKGEDILNTRLFVNVNRHVDITRLALPGMGKK